MNIPTLLKSKFAETFCHPGKKSATVSKPVDIFFKYFARYFFLSDCWIYTLEELPV